MQLQQLEYIVKIAECGSITKAAEQLFISQPSLTKSISHLEKEYGVQIFVRKPRGIELTDDGKDFVHYAKGVLTASQVLKQRFSSLAETDGRESRLFVGAQQLDFVYQMFLEIYEQNKDKNIHYNLVETDRNSVIEQVLNGAVDLGIFVRSSADDKTFLWHTEAKKLDIQVLSRAAVYACAGPKAPFYEKDCISTREAENSTCIVLDMGPRAKEDKCFGSTQHHFNLNRVVFFNTISACESFLAETDAVLFVAKWAIGCFKNPALRFFPVGPENKNELNTVNELLLVKRAGEPIDATEQQFIQLLERYFSVERDCIKTTLNG